MRIMMSAEESIYGRDRQDNAVPIVRMAKNNDKFRDVLNDGRGPLKFYAMYAHPSTSRVSTMRPSWKRTRWKPEPGDRAAATERTAWAASAVRRSGAN